MYVMECTHCIWKLECISIKTAGSCWPSPSVPVQKLDKKMDWTNVQVPRQPITQMPITWISLTQRASVMHVAHMRVEKNQPSDSNVSGLPSCLLNCQELLVLKQAVDAREFGGGWQSDVHLFFVIFQLV